MGSEAELEVDFEAAKEVDCKADDAKERKGADDTADYGTSVFGGRRLWRRQRRVGL